MIYGSIDTDLEIVLVQGKEEAVFLQNWKEGV